MVPTIKRLRQIADEFEQRAEQTKDRGKRSEIIDIVIRARFLISEIAQLLDRAKQMQDKELHV